MKALHICSRCHGTDPNCWCQHEDKIPDRPVDDDYDVDTDNEYDHDREFGA